MRHARFESLLEELMAASQGRVGQDFLGEVLYRVSVRAPEEVSRVDISRGVPGAHPGAAQREIPQGTVSKAVSALLGARLLEQGRKPLVKDGRALVPLRFGRGWGIAGASVKMSDGAPGSVTTILTGLDGHDVISTRTKVVDQRGDAAWGAVAGTIHEEITALLAEHDAFRDQHGKPPLRLFGVGVQVGAHVHDGTVVRTPGSVAVESTPLTDKLDKLFDCKLPIVVENDVNALAVLATHDARYPESDLVVVGVFDEGIGAGLVMDGRLRRGGYGMAMEIGHLTVARAPGLTTTDASLQDFDEVCPCGAAGHVDAFATPKRIRDLLHAENNAQATKGPSSDTDGEQTRAARVFAQAGAVLGRAMAHVINIVNPSRLIVWIPSEFADLPDDEAGSAYLSALRAEMEQAYSTGAHDAHLTLRPFDNAQIDEIGARAAALCVMDSFIEHAQGVDGCSTPQRRPRANREPPTVVAAAG